jgi:L-alanine-DL-glutamate epimerase-like enolase superfamily enzyme
VREGKEIGMKIVEAEIIPIRPRLVARAAAYNAHYPDWNLRTVCRLRADNGLVGYGDYRCPPPAQSVVAPLVGRSPFDFIGNDYNPAIGAALYDLMGKHLDVPAYKLLGQKVRDWVSVAAWTKPVPPETLRQEVQRAVAEGYQIMKMHSWEGYDIFEQNQAVEEVAPPGFLMHYDFNHNRNLVTVLPIITELERSRVVGFIEDPLRPTDVDGWRRLRAQVRVPLIMHGAPLGGSQEIIHGMADAYMTGGQIGSTLWRGGAWAGANIPCLLQITGGTLTKALAMHLGAVLPTCTMHSVNLDDQYQDDITTERIPVVEGSSPVPERPGLGLEVDEDALARLAAHAPTPVPRHVAALRRRGGHTIYFPSLTSVNVQRMTGREEGTIRGLRVELWDDDGTADFQRVYERVRREGPFVERAG